jgi:integrase
MARRRGRGQFRWKIRGVSVYKPSDRSTESDPWLLAYTEPGTGRRVVETAAPYEDLTYQRAVEVSRELFRHELGLVDARAERYAKEASRPLADVLADFQDALKSGGKRGVKQAGEVWSRVTTILHGLNCGTLAELDADEVQKWVADYIEEHGLSLETGNKYLKAIGQFGRWLRRKPARVVENPFDALEHWNAATDPRHARRALSVEELAALCGAVRADAAWHGITGEERYWLYQTAAQSGLRKSELASLSRSSFDLDGATITVQAGCSKRRREDVQPVRPDFLAALAPWLATRPATGPVFNVPQRAYRMIEHDLGLAKIAYRTPEGFADFHSLRHTYITILARSGAPITVVQTLARHSDLRLTRRYTHLTLLDQTRALEALPAVVASDAGAAVAAAAG